MPGPALALETLAVLGVSPGQPVATREPVLSPSHSSKPRHALLHPRVSEPLWGCEHSRGAREASECIEHQSNCWEEPEVPWDSLLNIPSPAGTE